MNKAVFLDRDGTINKDVGYLSKIDEFEFLPGVFETLAHLQKLGYLLIIITNQSGIGRGYYTDEDYNKLNNWMISEFKKRGIIITKTYYCPHYIGSSFSKYNVDCNCRKPKTGLFFLAAKENNIDFSKSICVGDSLRDCCICDVTQCRGFLIDRKDKKVTKPKNVTDIRKIGDLVDLVKE